MKEEKAAHYRTREIQFFDFYAIYGETTDNQGNLIVVGILHPEIRDRPQPRTTAIFPSREGPKDSWKGKIVDRPDEEQ